MTQQTINIGAAPNDGTGDPARTAFGKVNSNFNELYTKAGVPGMDGQDGEEAFNLPAIPTQSATVYYATKAFPLVITSRTALEQDPELTIKIYETAQYDLDVVMIVNGLTTSTQGIKVAMEATAVPAGLTPYWNTLLCEGAVSTSTSTVQTIQCSSAATAASFSVNPISPAVGCIRIRGRVYLAAGGTISAAIAQVTSSTNSVQLLPGSSMKLYKVGNYFSGQTLLTSQAVSNPSLAKGVFIELWGGGGGGSIPDPSCSCPAPNGLGGPGAYLRHFVNFGSPQVVGTYSFTFVRGSGGAASTGSGSGYQGSSGTSSTMTSTFPGFSTLTAGGGTGGYDYNAGGANGTGGTATGGNCIDISGATGNQPMSESYFGAVMDGNDGSSGQTNSAGGNGGAVLFWVY